MFFSPFSLYEGHIKTWKSWEFFQCLYNLFLLIFEKRPLFKEIYNRTHHKNMQYYISNDKQKVK